MFCIKTWTNKMATHMRNMRVCFLWRKSLRRAKVQILERLITRHSSDLVVNHKWQLDPRMEVAFDEDANLKHRQHPGIMQIKREILLPATLQAAIKTMIEKYPTADLQKRSEEFAQYIWSRHRPVEEPELQHRATHLQEEVQSTYNTDVEDYRSREEIENIENEVKQKVMKRLRKDVYHWKPIEYNAYTSFRYLIGRIKQDYSTLYQIFSEIAKRNPDFSPATMFDFGSGVGSSIWAANETWKQSLTEHYCVDASADMNTIARLLLQGGEEDQAMVVPGVYFRHFMPSSSEKQYDLVVSAFSLLELPNQTDRLNTLYDLWRRTENYLIIVENGTTAGFQSVLEARDFLMQFKTNDHYSEEERTQLEGHVFAPCTHEKACGRYVRQDGTPCNFIVPFTPLEQSKKGNEKKNHFKYSYVVLKKGPRGKAEVWPRIVRDTSYPSKRVHLRTCCPNGDLQMSIITAAKHGRNLYWCARACKWGDLLPVVPKTTEEETNSVGNEQIESEEALSINYNAIK